LKILFILNHFYPETGAIRTEYELSNFLAKRGNVVYVITTYPRKYRVPEELKSKLVISKSINSFTIEKHRKNFYTIRVLSFISPCDNVAYRLIELLTSLPMLALVATLCNVKYDAVVCGGDIEILVLLAGIFVKILRRRPLIAILHDISLQQLKDTQVLKNTVLIKILEIIEKFVYRMVDRIVVHSESNKKILIKRGADASKVKIVYLWADLNKIKPFDNKNILRNKWNKKWVNRFIVSFAGIMHFPQGLEVVIEAANLLKEVSDIHFLMIGEGPVKPLLLNLVKKYRLNNIDFLPLLPKDKYVEILQLSDVCLVTLRKGYTQPVIPSKLIEIMAAGSPVILSVPNNNDSIRIIEKAKCGIWVEAGNPEMLAKAILKLYRDKVKLRDLGINARKFAEKHFNLEIAAMKYEKIINDSIII